MSTASASVWPPRSHADDGGDAAGRQRHGPVNNVIDGANHKGIEFYGKQSLLEDNEIKNIALIQNLNKSGMGCDTDDSGGSVTKDGAGVRFKIDKQQLW